MLKFLLTSLLLALGSLCQSTSAQAAPIEIYFSGIFSQLTAGGCFICGPYNAVITFDTGDGLFQQTGPSSGQFATPAVDNGIIHAQFSNGVSIFSDGGGDYIDWSPGFLSTNIGSGFSHLSINAGTINYVQYGTCGTRCASLSVGGITASPVPGPVAGAGLPAFLVAITVLVALRRSRRDSQSFDELPTLAGVHSCPEHCLALQL